MMSEEAISVPSNSNLRGSMVQIHDPNSNSNPNPNPNSNPSVKRKRSLPGTPDPDAEVIALSPKSLMATNRFICEVCNKGFQRDQNLQLHRRGHNLPWKLRQRSKQEVVRKKVYVCPEKSCVHHDPCRALGDLTGIKKHFSRKHGEKKWKCDKCSKKYAVQSDWKAHNKICGTRQYKCDCGTIFSRKDSFVTHRAFCDAMAEQSARMTSLPGVLSNFGNDILINAQAPRMMPQGLQLQGFQQEFGGPGPEPFMGNFTDADHDQKLRLPLWLDQANPQLHHPLNVPSNSSVFSSGTGTTMPEANMFGTSPQAQWLNYRHPEASFTSANVSMPHVLKLEQEENKRDLSHSVSSLYPHGGPSHMSATPLFQKAAQIESSRINGNSPFDTSNNAFGLLGSNISSTSINNRNNNVVEIQKIFKHASHGDSFNHMVNSQASTNVGGGFSLPSTKGLDHTVMPRNNEEWQWGQAPIMDEQVHSSSNNQDHLTKDFMGVGDDSLSRTLQQNQFMNLQSQFREHY
ncbi:zinc finger protein BALDIBIS-like [Abrus precatorius]|uniref:Zinc finger protein BALDIBIS-like n=1 Tax=Abrus precatorius TaxID=3816 RepID=A0A8B8K9K2_ABRPR|nr:zinc finger protein BALDIBIS-like [Abrus precatorius]XP_027340450.1 zinc finger protein BALDIBIS-like [Abrus precatorius]XP_027340451.1 zinc finger protein BALDIBIS-like [Abrus precatorius]XP_027340452.1 zinc finger protein BALDIBIS-like [Abrus precatorius]XP_027340453.1 zinc finger protein BALDIBIS-like [Abrus precatorius]